MANRVSRGSTRLEALFGSRQNSGAASSYDNLDTFMAKHLGIDEDRGAILERIATLRFDSRARWGRMPVHQMICHVNDSYRCPLGEKTASPASGFLQRTVVKFVALRVPLHWPKGVPTRPEMEQGVGGTKPVEFERDRAELVELVNRFSKSVGALAEPSHPIFGPMSDFEWLRWGWLHADHHLRQFGA